MSKSVSTRVIGLCLVWCMASVVFAQSPVSDLNLTLGEQRVKFAPTRSFQDMRLEVVNSAGETVFTHLTSEAEFDWNLRAGNGEPLAAGLYSYVLMLKFSEEQVSRHRGNLIVEQGQQQVWLTTQDGATVSGSSLNATRSGGRSIAGLTSTGDKSVKAEKGDEKSNNLTDKLKNARSEKASLLGTQDRIAKFAAGGVNLIDSVVTESAGNIGIGTTTPGAKLHVEHGGGAGLLVKSTSIFSAIDIDAFSGDAALRFVKGGVLKWNINNEPATDDLEIFEPGGGGSRMRIQNTTGNVGIGGGEPQRQTLGIRHQRRRTAQRAGHHRLFCQCQ